VIVHILHFGRTLCGFGYGMFPGEWPTGHRWTYLGTDDATCVDCLREAARLPSVEPSQVVRTDTPGRQDTPGTEGS